MISSVAAGQHTTLFIARPSDELSDRPRHPFDVDAPEACLGCGKASEDDELLECEKVRFYHRLVGGMVVLEEDCVNKRTEEKR